MGGCPFIFVFFIFQNWLGNLIASALFFLKHRKIIIITAGVKLNIFPSKSY